MALIPCGREDPRSQTVSTRTRRDTCVSIGSKRGREELEYCHYSDNILQNLRPCIMKFVAKFRKLNNQLYQSIYKLETQTLNKKKINILTSFDLKIKLDQK